MIKCTPIVTAISTSRLAFHVIITDVVDGIEAVHTMYGGGSGRPGKKIGEASVILGESSSSLMYVEEKTEYEVLYIDGYRDDGKEFTVGIEKAIITACEKAAQQLS